MSTGIAKLNFPEWASYAGIQHAPSARASDILSPEAAEEMQVKGQQEVSPRCASNDSGPGLRRERFGRRLAGIVTKLLYITKIIM